MAEVPVTGLASEPSQQQPSTSPASSGAVSTGAPGGGVGDASSGLPENLRGKDPVAEYTKLERHLGELRNEVGTLRSREADWQRYQQGWEPILSQFNYDPSALAGVLQEAARAASEQGDRAGAADLRSAAKQVRGWGDAITTREQEQWIQEHVSGYVNTQVEQLNSQYQQAFQAMLLGLVNYVNKYGDLTLRAIEEKLSNPDLSLQDILGEAVRLSQSNYDPIKWAAASKTAPAKQAQAEKTLREKLRKEIEDEIRNQNLTTGVGAGAPAPRPLRGAPKTIEPRTPEGFSLERARESVAQRIRNLTA